MKKLLSLLMAAMLLPIASGAADLGPNQMLMGHYMTDDLATSGWGSTTLLGVATVATDFTADDLAMYQGGNIVAMRVGLFQATPVSRMFIIPIDPDGALLMNEMTEWTCDVSAQAGWNTIEMETPYTINVPEGYGLRIGFDYEQPTKSAKPLSVVKVGTTCPTYHYVDGTWKQLVLSSKGNLSMQCVVEGDNFPEYVIRVRNISLKGLVKTGADVPFTFETCNKGATPVPAGGCTYEIAVDGEVVNTLTNPSELTYDYIGMNDVIHTTGLTAGGHTLSITPVSVNGEAIDNSSVFTATFATYDYGYDRQMHLVEQFTSTNCTYCPLGTANIINLTHMRDDIAWVCHHEYMGGNDPFQTAQTDSLPYLEGIDGYPEASFDRTVGISSASEVYAVITGLSATTMSQFLDYVSDQSPAWATVNVNSTFDASAREAVITIDGDLVPGFDEIMGEDAKLTVFLTEDNLPAPQYNQGYWDYDYVHNNVTRMALGSVKGVEIKKVGDNKYKNEFTVTIPSTWKAENMNVVAFISRPLGNKLKDIYVTNCNKRKFGEYDEPTSMKGDVNGDQNIDISDATALINYILTGNDTDVDLAAAECDGAAGIDISDATALINYLLTGAW